MPLHPFHTIHLHIAFPIFLHGILLFLGLNPVLLDPINIFLNLMVFLDFESILVR